MSQIPKILGTSCTALYGYMNDALHSPVDTVNNDHPKDYSSSTRNSPFSTGRSEPPGYTYFLTGPYQSGKSSALEAVAQELSMEIFHLTPERTQEDYPDDTSRGLVQIFSTLLKVASDSDSVSGTTDLYRPLLIIMDDLDIWLPSSFVPTTGTGGSTKNSSGLHGQSVFTPKDETLTKPQPGGQRANTADTDIVRILFYYIRCINAQQLHGQKFLRKIFLAGITSHKENIGHSIVTALFQRSITFTALTIPERQQILSTYLSSSYFSVTEIETLAISTGHGFLLGDLMNVLYTFERLFYPTSTSSLPSSLLSLPYALLKSLLVSHTPYIMLSNIPLPTDSSSSRHSFASESKSNTAHAKQLSVTVQRLHETIRQLAGVINIEDNRQFLSKVSEHKSSVSMDTDEIDGTNAETAKFSSSSTHANLGFVFSGLGTLLRPSVSSIGWSDIVGLSEAKLALQQMVTWPLLPEKIKAMEKLHIVPPTGILLYGPPGTGKTLLAKAVANELGGRFINIPIAAILRSGLGDSEQALAAAFSLAEIASPSVIFIDEIQALFMNRNHQDNKDESTRFAATLTAQFILSMDAIRRKMGTSNEPSKRILLMAATNVPEAIDPALLQPGRFDRIVYIGLPTAEDRKLLIENYLSRQIIYSKDSKDRLNLTEWNALVHELVQGTEGYSSADIKNMLQQSVSKAIFEYHLQNNNIMDMLNDEYNKVLNLNRTNGNSSPLPPRIPLYDANFRTVLSSSQSSVDKQRINCLQAWKP